MNKYQYAVELSTGNTSYFLAEGHIETDKGLFVFCDSEGNSVAEYRKGHVLGWCRGVRQGTEVEYT